MIMTIEKYYQDIKIQECTLTCEKGNTSFILIPDNSYKSVITINNPISIVVMNSVISVDSDDHVSHYPISGKKELSENEVEDIFIRPPVVTPRFRFTRFTNDSLHVSFEHTNGDIEQVYHRIRGFTWFLSETCLVSTRHNKSDVLVRGYLQGEGYKEQLI